ncbi:MAG: PaaI family thioesterase [Chitinispirillaceae bacterium]|nr:PaaI family thioesterase [Chitinispirillaceae bacterium]
MRSLTGEAPAGGGTDIAEGDRGPRAANPCIGYENNLARLKQKHHSRCLFNRESSWIPDILVSFDDKGVLHGEFIFTEEHQGYEDRVHGGLIAGIIDASMAQCLMGHGAVGYTADLTVKYRHPMIIRNAATFVTRIISVNIGILYTLECEIVQSRKLVAEATGRFYKFA